MKKVMMKGPINDFNISLSNFFIMFTVLLRYVAILKFTRIKNSALTKALLKHYGISYYKIKNHQLLMVLINIFD
jgi:hypothetical protein